MPQPGEHFGRDQFGQRGFIPGDFRPSKVVMNEHWMAARDARVAAIDSRSAA